MFDQLADIIRHAMGYNEGTDRDSGVASLGRILLSQFSNSSSTVALGNTTTRHSETAHGTDTRYETTGRQNRTDSNICGRCEVN